MASTLVVFLLGLAVGSFLNVVIIRGARSESLGGRSRCESCGVQLSPLELIPILSFVVQKGRCKNCSIALSWQYPFVELGTALSYAGAWHLWQKGILFLELPIPTFLLSLVIISGIGAAVVILASDVRYRIIPNGAVLILAAAGITLRIFDKQSFWTSIVSASAFSLVLAAFWFFSKGKAMGLGDAKLIFTTSLIIGYPLSIPAFLFSFWLGGAAGILFLVSGAKNMKDLIPFGPFILGGTILAYALGHEFLVLSGLLEFL